MKFGLFAALVLLTVGLQAQVSVGLRGGILSNKWNYSGDNVDSLNDIVKNRTGLVGGLVLEIRFNKGFAIQPEVNWSQKGTRSEISGSVPLLGNYSVMSRTRLNYVEVPILVKAGFGAGPVRFDLLGGPSFAYAVSGTYYNKSDFFGLVTEDKGSIKFDDPDFEDLERNDLGLQFGAALSVGTANTKFFLDGRYLYGVKNQNSTNDDYKVYNRGSALSAGVLVSF